MTRRPPTATLLTFAVILIGLVAAYCAILGRAVLVPAVAPSSTPTVQVKVIPASPSTPTPRDIFTVPDPSPELIWSTPQPSATPSPTPTVTVGSTGTPTVERSPVQRG